MLSASLDIYWSFNRCSCDRSNDSIGLAGSGRVKHAEVYIGLMTVPQKINEDFLVGIALHVFPQYYDNDSANFIKDQLGE